MRIAIVGGGMAGIASGAELAVNNDVLVLEQEFQTGYHSTGRSAAVLHLAFENDVVHRLSLLSESFYLDPPENFSELATPIDHIAFDLKENQEIVEGFLEEWIERCPWLRPLGNSELHELAPLLSQDQEVGTLDTRSLRLDVDAILQGFSRKLMRHGGQIHTSHRLQGITRKADRWEITTSNNALFEADILINAAGAWADDIAELSGLDRIGIQPRRRTGVLINLPDVPQTHPMCYRASGGLYFKPEGSLFMISPADAEPTNPSDVQPDELDVAIAIDTFNRCTTANIERPASQWAGLRSFAGDGIPVVGWDPSDPHFFWVAGLGGFGIQTAPAYSQLVSQIIDERIEGELATNLARDMSPSRFEQETLTL